MARILKEDEYNAKRNEILDFAANLIYSKGYRRMTIQDILDGLHISRGALYHYFDSKQALLEALIDRMGQQGLEALLPIVNDPNLNAIQKFRRYFEQSNLIKSLQKNLIESILSIWYSEDNAIVRQKLTTSSMKFAAGKIFEPIIRQGIQEKVFTTPHPDQAAKIVLGIALTLTDTVVELLLGSHQEQEFIEEMGDILNAYYDAIERVLGAPQGSLRVISAEDLKAWWNHPQSNEE